MSHLNRIEVEEKIQAVETRMVREWNGRGEPWCVFDPETGDVRAEGLGVIVLRCGKPYTYCKYVTGLFEELTASELKLDNLKKITKSWLEQHTTGGESEGVFSEQTRIRLDRILDAWQNACEESGLSLRLKHEADISCQVEEVKLRGQIVSHYHPSGGPPTKEDETFFFKYALLELRTVTDKGVYTYRSIDGRTDSHRPPL